MRFFLRRMWGRLASVLFPGYSSCRRCERPWKVCKGHMTPYSDSGGCFPLCEECWKELTPEDRIPYYIELVESWRAYGYNDHNGQSWDDLWSSLRDSVLAGK